MGGWWMQGPLYASPANADAPSMIIFRPLESWAPNGEWSLSLPEGENVVAVAAGRSFLAAATSARLLRLFSTSGEPSVACVKLPHQPASYGCSRQQGSSCIVQAGALMLSMAGNM